jgi:hypothetical protein
MSPEMTIGKGPSRTGFQVPFKGVRLQSFFGERSAGGCLKIFLKFQSFPLIRKSNSRLDFPRDVFEGMFTFALIMNF